MHKVDVEQSLREMSRRANRFFTVCAEIGLLLKLLKNGEQPCAVILENLLTHDEHVAEAGLIAIQKRISILLVVGMHGA